MQFFCARKTKQESFQMVTILSPSRTVTVSHTQPVRHRYNVGFKHSILKTLSVLAHIAEQNAPFKNLVHNGVDFYVQNALKLTYEQTLIPKIFPGVIPPDPSQKGDGGRRGGKRREGKDKKGGNGV